MCDLIEVLKQRRIVMKKTQQYIANKMYVSQNTFSDYENERKELKLSRLNDLATELNGEIKFIPNEKFSTIYFHQLLIIANDEKTKEIMQSERFKESFNELLNGICYDYDYSTKISNETLRDNIILNDKTIKNKLFTVKKDICYLNGEELNKSIKKDIVVYGNLYKSDIIFPVLFDLNEDKSNKIDDLISSKLYDFIKEHIEDFMGDYFENKAEYETYLETEDMFIVFNSEKLYDRIDEEESGFKFHIH